MSSELLKYNADVLLTFPLIDAGTQDFVTDYVSAAGDAKLWTDQQISTNPTALILGFDSLSEIPAQGAQLDENGAGTAEGVVAFTVITSGTVGGGTAAGFFFMRSVTGQAWVNNDQIDINGGTADIATADSTTYDLAATAGLIADLGNGLHAAALSPTEMTCAQGELHIVDSATKAIEDQAVVFRTGGNASAYYAYDPFDSVRLGLTALPNAAADAAGGIPVSDAGGLDLDTQLAATNEVTAARMGALTDWIDGGRLDLIIDLILADTGELQSVLSAGILARTNNPNLNALLGVADTAGEDVPGQTAFEVADEVYTGGTHNIADSLARRIRDLQEFGTYEGGAIWIDTVNGSAGTTDFESGTAFNPVDSITDANTLAASLGLNRFMVAPGSSITFAAAQSGQIFSGEEWTLALGGQDISGSSFRGASVSGVAAGTGTQFFIECLINGTSYKDDTHLIRCGFRGAIVLLDAGDFFTHQCHMGAQAGVTPSINFGTGVGLSTDVHLHDWSGRVEFLNLGNQGTDVIHLDGQGKAVFNVNCTGGTVNWRGLWEIENNGSGITFNDDARYDQAQILQAITSDDVKFQGADIAATLADTADMQPKLGTPAGADISADIAVIEGQTDDIGVAGAGLTAIPATVDWLNGGRLDLILDAIKAVTDLLPDSGALSTIGTDTARLTAVRAAVLTDWIDAGRLDVLLDAIKAKTDQMTFTKANELDGNMQSINGAGVVGDGNATPWDGA